MRRARHGRDTRHFECRYLHKDGRVVSIAWSGIWSEPEQQHFFIGRDMTERKRLEEAERKVKETLAAVIDASPVAIICLNATDSNVMVWSRAAEQVFGYTAIETIGKPYPLVPADQESEFNSLFERALAGETLRDVRVKRRRKDGTIVDISFDAAAMYEAGSVKAVAYALTDITERNKLEQQLRLDEVYASAHSEVEPGAYVMVAVSDTGGGIPASIRDKVFEPFFTTKDIGKGTGLGLSMVYGYVKQSGGHIKLYSEEGHGTTFKIYLPRAAGESSELAEPSTDPSPVGGSETILVVEDDPVVRASVIVQLESLGYTTIIATSAWEALAIIDSGALFDLMFTDVIMPGSMNGRRLAEEAAKRRPSLKILFTSGYTENAIVHHGRLDPGVLLLAKPYRKSDLARMIRRALSGSNQPEMKHLDIRIAQ